MTAEKKLLLIKIKAAAEAIELLKIEMSSCDHCFLDLANCAFSVTI